MPPVRILPLAAALFVLAAACSADPAPTGSPATDSGVGTGPSATESAPEHLRGAVEAWDTDWSNTTIDLTELVLGIPAEDPRDRIPPIDEPVFEPIEAASEWLIDREPGLLLIVGETARFYPLQIMNLHEIVNDEVEGIPVAITYCPLCNTAIAFDRRLDGTTLRLGVSGLLRKLDLVMWDDATDSLFQQITGEGIVGSYAGAQLEALPSAIVRFGDLAAEYPEAEVLSRDTGSDYPYGINPYEGYSSRSGPAGTDERYPALSRVVGVTIGDDSKAYPFPEIEPLGAVNDSVGSTPIVVFWGAADTADALDNRTIANSRSIGTGIAFNRTVDGEVLTFESADDGFRDIETESRWTILGVAEEGPLAGSTLELVPHRNEFWFAWTRFFPDAPVFEG